jgi:hypothetical protein
MNTQLSSRAQLDVAAPLLSPRLHDDETHTLTKIRRSVILRRVHRRTGGVSRRRLTLLVNTRDSICSGGGVLFGWVWLHSLVQQHKWQLGVDVPIPTTRQSPRY